MKIYIPPQVKRLLFFLVIFIVLFVIARRLLTPDTYGDLGNYRAASLIDNEEFEPVFAGHESCLDCHDDVGEALSNDMHGEINCETCHSSGYQHTQDPGSVRMLIPEGRDFCGKCHSQNAARPAGLIIQIDLEDHNIEFDCKECHNPHQPWDLRN